MKLVLNTKELTDCFFEDTRLLGIVAPMKDYQFCWHVNNWLGIDWRKSSDIEIQLNRKGRMYYFSVYEYAEQTNCLRHYLYNNQYDGEYLLPEFRHLDFLWLMKEDFVTDATMADLVQSLRNIPGVQMVTELTNEKIKNKEHLVF
jgi:hypothetical protein